MDPSDAHADADKAGLLTATAHLRSRPGRVVALTASEDGTPGQIQLTRGSDPATSIVVSWASPSQAICPRVLVTRHDGWTRTITAQQLTCPGGSDGEQAFSYQAELTRLQPDSRYSYTVTADNDTSATPFTASFRTAPVGRAPLIRLRPVRDRRR